MEGQADKPGRSKRGSRKLLKRAAITVAAVIPLVVVSSVGLDIYMYGGFCAISTKGARYPAPRIRSIISPGIGCPALVSAGGTMEVEVDLI